MKYRFTWDWIEHDIFPQDAYRPEVAPATLSARFDDPLFVSVHWCVRAVVMPPKPATICNQEQQQEQQQQQKVGEITNVLGHQGEIYHCQRPILVCTQLISLLRARGKPPKEVHWRSTSFLTALTDLCKLLHGLLFWRPGKAPVGLKRQGTAPKEKDPRFTTNFAGT